MNWKLFAQGAGVAATLPVGMSFYLYLISLAPVFMLGVTAVVIVIGSGLLYGAGK